MKFLKQCISMNLSATFPHSGATTKTSHCKLHPNNPETSRLQSTSVYYCSLGLFRDQSHDHSWSGYAIFPIGRSQGSLTMTKIE